MSVSPSSSAGAVSNTPQNVQLLSTARYIFRNVKDNVQRETLLRALLGEAYTEMKDEIERELSPQTDANWDMTKSVFDRLFFIHSALLANLEKLAETQKNQQETLNELKRGQESIYDIQLGQNSSIFKKFLGRWKKVKCEHTETEMEADDDSSHDSDSSAPHDSDSSDSGCCWLVGLWFEAVPEGVVKKRYNDRGKLNDKMILTADLWINARLKLERKDSMAVYFKFPCDTSFKTDCGTTITVEGNTLIYSDHTIGHAVTLEKYS